MNDYIECFVAFLDILGFKNIINKSEFAEVQQIFISILENNKAINELKKTEKTGSDKQKELDLENYNEALSSAKVYIMSDSIVIAVPCKLKESLAAVIDICYMIQLQLYKLETPILLRGAIAKGLFYMGNLAVANSTENTIVFGKGLVDAYLAQEYYAVYPRVIVAKDVLSGYKISLDSDFTLPVDKEDGYFYLDTLSNFLVPDDPIFGNDVDREGDMDYFTEKFEASDSYKSIKKLIDDNLMYYNDANLRKKYIWLGKEVSRIKKEYLKKHGLIFSEDIYATPV